jgi:hypothetical protein
MDHLSPNQTVFVKYNIVFVKAPDPDTLSEILAPNAAGVVLIQASASISLPGAFK